MKKRIVYIVGDLSYPNGMSRVLSQKVNYLAEHSDFEMYVVLTENASMPHYYELSKNVTLILRLSKLCPYTAKYGTIIVKRANTNGS